MTRDDAAYKVFVAERYPTLVRTAMLMGCSRPDAEDVAQETLIRCYRSWSRVSRADNPDRYAYRILVNNIAHGRRRRWRGELPHSSLPEPELQNHPGSDPAAVVPLSHTVRESLRHLTRPQREVLVLRYFADLTEAQIASILGIAQGTVKSRAARAIAALARDPALTGLLATRTQEKP